MFTDSREPLVEVASQILCVVLESNIHLNRETNQYSLEEKNSDSASKTNLFINYVSRIHRDEVSIFIFTSLSGTFIYQPHLLKRISISSWKAFVDFSTTQWPKLSCLVHARRSLFIKSFWYYFGNSAISIRFQPAFHSILISNHQKINNSYFSRRDSCILCWKAAKCSISSCPFCTFSSMLEMTHVSPV